MAGITLSAQPIEDAINYGALDIIHVISTRPVPEHPQQAYLRYGTAFHFADPMPRMFGTRHAPSTPWSRLLYRCRIARAQNHEAITEAIREIGIQGFDVIESV